MACPECEKNKKKTAKDFTKAVVEIKNPDKLVLFRKVVVPASMGTEEQFPASVGKFSNVLLQYEANGDTYLYSSDGIPTQLSSDVSELQRQLDELKIVVTNEIADRIAADGTINSRIDQEILDRQAADNGLSDALAAEVAARKAADNTLDGKITAEKNARIAADNTLQTNINNEATARAAADSTLDGKITTEKEAREAADQTLQTNINTEATTRANADTALGTRITNETTARQNADNTLDGRITTEANTRSAADSALAEDISAEVTRAKAAETALGGRIDDEATARAAADTTLDGKIAAEATARANADSTLDGRITDEATARANADTALGTRITNETTARTNADTALGNRIDNEATARANADTAIENKLNRNVLYDLEMETDANNVTFVEDKINLKTGATTTERDVIPAASTTTAGTISASEYISLVDAEEKISALLEGAVAVDNLPANPTQAQLTAAWKTATGKDELINRASIYDSANQLIHTYYTNVAEWKDSPAGGQITIDQFTNNAAGIIKGSTTDGNVSANLDGTGTVSGWTSLKNTVAGKQDALTAGNNISISGSTISATDTTYSAGTGLSLTGTTFAVDTTTIAQKSDIPTVNNATLTIQKNGSTVKTFTANASTNVTANITVPTKTSDLTNDSNFPVDANYVHTDNNFTTALKNKLDGIAAGAEVNQNAFSNVKVGGTTVAADSKTDTLELVAGSNVTLTPDATNDKVTIAATVPTKTSDLTNDSGYITNTVNNLTNYTTTTGMNTALDGKVNIQSINLSNKTTTLLDEAKALGAANVDYARFICRTDGGAANISDLPVSGKGFSCVMYQTRHNTNSDYHYELVCYVKGDYRPYYARMETSTSALTWSQISTAAFSGSYNDLTNKPAINNGTLTIQKNGTNVQTFTANQSTNATANITVPTKVTDLTDATNYVAKDGDFYVTGEGSNFSMTGTSQNVYADLKVKGDTFQQTYSGKNLCGIPDQTFTHQAVTVTIEGGEVTLNGTATGTGTKNIPLIKSTVLNGSYTTNLIYVSGTISNSGSNINLRKTSDHTLVGSTQTDIIAGNNSRAYTVSNEDVELGLYINPSGAVFNNFKFKIQIVAGSTADYDFEPYVGGTASPNPDYPQEVEVVIGRQVISSCGRNMWNKKTAVLGGTWQAGSSTYKDGVLRVPSSGTSGVSYAKLREFTFIAGQTYTITFKSTGDYHQMRLLTANNGYPSAGSGSGTTTTHTLVYTPVETETLGLAFYTVVGTNKVCSFYDVQIEKGSTANTYNDYTGKEFEVNLGDIELCKIGDYQDYIYPSNGKWYLHKATNKISLTGDETWTEWTSGGMYRYYTGNYSSQIQGLPQTIDALSSHFDFYGVNSGTLANNKFFFNMSSGTTVANGNITLNDINLTSVSALQTWLRNNGVVIYCPLVTPTDTEITNPLLVAQLDDLWRNLQSGTNTTNVNVEGDLPAILGVTAFTNTLASAMAGINERMNRLPAIPQITMTTTDPGEGQTLADNHYIAVYE